MSPPPPDTAGRTPHPDDLTRIEALFASLVDRAPRERARLLDTVEDQVLRARVAALLQAHDKFPRQDPEEPAAFSLAVGDTVGPYRLLERVGAGGMGEVFRAERADGLFTHQVAIKITRAQVTDPDLLRRFSTERQILASLDHPNIVGLLDGGATRTGQAYLIMEYLDGQPLTTYCREHALDLEARLRLFCTICDAVQHAHQHGIVHRDLKPGNLLVGRDGVPKVVDFGIAKLLDPASPAGATSAMLPGPLTLNYASPEQLRGLPVTTAVDVYALGVVLYELLAGRRPYEAEGQPLDHILRLVVEEEPVPPSGALAEGGSPLPYQLRRLRGDIDAIVGKAIAKAPAARYGSAGELSADIRRWLDGDPVLARARSSAYVVRRLAARHRTLVGMAAVACVAIITALAVAAWQWQIARQAVARAESSLRDTRQLASALIFKIHDAVTPLPGSTPVRRTIVDEALTYLARVESTADPDPSLRLELAAAHRQLGGILGNPSRPNLGDRPGAIAQYERARQLIAPMLGQGDAFEVVTASVDGNVMLATLYAGAGDRARALAIARETLNYITAFRARHQNDPRTDRLLGQVLFNVATLTPGEESIAAWEKALVHYEQMLAAAPAAPENQRNVALVGKYLGSRLEGAGQTEAARAHYTRALALDERRLAATPDSRAVQFDAAISYSNVASVSETLNDFATARQLFEKSLKLRRQLSESDPANVQAADRLAYLLGRISRFHRVAGEPQLAVALAEQARSAFEQLHARTRDRQQRFGLADTLLMLGQAQDAAGRPAAACQAYRQLHQMNLDPKDNLAAGDRADEAARVARQVEACTRSGF